MEEKDAMLLDKILQYGIDLSSETPENDYAHISSIRFDLQLKESEEVILSLMKRAGRLPNSPIIIETGSHNSGVTFTKPAELFLKGGGYLKLFDEEKTKEQRILDHEDRADRVNSMILFQGKAFWISFGVGIYDTVAKFFLVIPHLKSLLEWIHF